MRNSKKILIMSFIIILTFLFNMNSVLAGFNKATASVNGDLTQNGDEYTLRCDNVNVVFNVIEVGKNNEKKSDCLDSNGNQMGGTFWDQSDSKRLKKLTNELAKDGDYHYLLWAHSKTCATTSGITISVNNSTTGKKCSGQIAITSNKSDYKDENASVKFELDIKGNSENKEEFSTKVDFSVVYYGGNQFCWGKKQGAAGGNYSIEHDGTTEVIAKAATECATGNEQSCETFQTEKQENQTISGSSIESGKKAVAQTTKPAGDLAGQGQAIQCDNSLSDFIGKYWKYFIIATPILLMVMITMDFFKALFSSDQDLIKKASNNAIKRVIAAILLLFLPLIISTILGFFGLELCI